MDCMKQGPIYWFLIYCNCTAAIEREMEFYKNTFSNMLCSKKVLYESNPNVRIELFYSTFLLRGSSKFRSKKHA